MAAPSYRTASAAQLRTTLPAAEQLPTGLDLVLYRGDTFTLHVDVTDAVGAPFDVTAATWDADIRLTPDTAATIATFDITPVDGTPTAITVTLPAEQAALLPEKAVWDLEMTSGESVYTLLAGKVTTTLDVSKVR